MAKKAKTPAKRTPAKKFPRVGPGELVTVLDFIRFAVSRYAEAAE